METISEVVGIPSKVHFVNVGPNMVGSVKWRENTMRTIRDNQRLVERSNKTVSIGRSVDPLPHVRDVLAESSNDYALHYGRQVRLIVHRLRESIVATNEEMKSLNRVRELLERMHEHMRKDLKTNERCQATRLTRPTREKCSDAADHMLSGEKVNLDNLKKLLETHLNLVKIQLQALGDVRGRLTRAHNERAQVVDLMCYAVSSVGHQNKFVTQRNFAPAADGRSPTMHEAAAIADVCSKGPIFPVDPLGPFTNACDDSLEEARLAREHSISLRHEAHLLLERVDVAQKTVHQAVNRALQQKIAETENLKVHLNLSIGANRSSLSHSQRYFDKTEQAFFQLQGPESTHNLLVHEKVDRPMITTLQQHPGTNLPEPQQLVTAGDGLRKALEIAGRNIGVLQLQRRSLLADCHDKLVAANIDGSVVKLRRRRYPHRWVIGGAVEHSWF